MHQLLNPPLLRQRLLRLPLMRLRLLRQLLLRLRLPHPLLHHRQLHLQLLKQRPRLHRQLLQPVPRLSNPLPIQRWIVNQWTSDCRFNWVKEAAVGTNGGLEPPKMKELSGIRITCKMEGIGVYGLETAVTKMQRQYEWVSGLRTMRIRFA